MTFCRGLTEAKLAHEVVRAHTIEAGDILHDHHDETVTSVRRDPPGEPGRRVHLDTELRTIHLPLNEPTTISRVGGEAT